MKPLAIFGSISVVGTHERLQAKLRLTKIFKFVEIFSVLFPLIMLQNIADNAIHVTTSSISAVQCRVISTSFEMHRYVLSLMRLYLRYKKIYHLCCTHQLSAPLDPWVILRVTSFTVRDYSELVEQSGQKIFIPAWCTVVKRYFRWNQPMVSWNFTLTNQTVAYITSPISKWTWISAAKHGDFKTKLCDSTGMVKFANQISRSLNPKATPISWWWNVIFFVVCCISCRGSYGIIAILFIIDLEE